MKAGRVVLRIAVHAAIVTAPVIALGRMAELTRPRALACIACMLLFGEVENAASDAPDPSRAGAPGTRLALVSALALLSTGWAAIGVPSATAAGSPAWLGALLVLAGIALRAAAIRTLGPAFTSEIVAAPGRARVTHGIYAWFRHPSEIGLFFVALGIACLGASAAALAVIVAVLAPSIWIRVAREDRALGR